jgi:hypothetical protein
LASYDRSFHLVGNDPLGLIRRDRGRNADGLGRDMQWYVYLITIAASTFLWKVAVELIARPVQSVLRLRREALARMLSFRNMALPRPRETAITSREIREYDQAVRNVRSAERTFANLGARCLALSESEPTIRTLMALFGFDIVEAGHELINLSLIYATAGCDRDHHQIVAAFAATNAALAASRCHSHNSLIKIRLEPMYLGSVPRPRRIPPSRQRSASHAH